MCCFLWQWIHQCVNTYFEKFHIVRFGYLIILDLNLIPLDILTLSRGSADCSYNDDAESKIQTRKAKTVCFSFYRINPAVLLSYSSARCCRVSLRAWTMSRFHWISSYGGLQAATSCLLLSALIWSVLVKMKSCYDPARLTVGELCSVQYRPCVLWLVSTSVTVVQWVGSICAFGQMIRKLKHRRTWTQSRIFSSLARNYRLFITNVKL